MQRLVVFPTEQQPFGGAVTTPGELLAALQSGPRYAVFAEVKTANRRILGAFEHIEFAGDRIQLMVSRDPLRLSEAGKLFHQDRSAMDNVQRFIADDGASIELNASDAVRQDATNAGTRLTFEQPAGVEYCYKARPLNGIWATAPYLHNGSVPNLDELLKPAAQRAQKFRVGSREFDAERVGFRTDVGDFEFDTALPGNSSAGHEYSLALTDLERKQLIEYMKSL